MAGMFLAGAATKTITPNLTGRDVYLAGLSGQRVAQSVEQPLHVRALALRYGKQVAIILACDLYGIARDDLEEVRTAIAAQGIDPKAVIVSATNTINGPDTLGLWSGDQGVDAVYLASLKRAMSQAAIEALTFGCPVQMRTIQLEHTANPLTILQFERPSTEILATIVLSQYALQSDAQATSISSNSSGQLCQQLEQSFGGMAMVLVGARTPEHTLPDAELRFDLLQEQLNNAPLREIEHLRFQEQVFELPIDQEQWQARQAAGKGRARHIGQSYTARCSSIVLGDLVLIGVPGLLAPELAQEFSEQLAMVACADDMLGVIGNANEPLNPSSQVTQAVRQALGQLLSNHNLTL